MARVGTESRRKHADNMGILLKVLGIVNMIIFIYLFIFVASNLILIKVNGQ